MSRLARWFCLALLGAAVAAAPSLADGTPPPATTTTTTTTTTTPATTTTTPTPAAPKPKPKSTAGVHVTKSVARVETVFPAAGELLVNSVPVRVSPSPSAHVIKVMTQFRDDYRIQEMFAVATRMGTNHKPWYKVSVPMRPNGTMGWIPAGTVKLAPTIAEIDVRRNARTIDIMFHGKHVWHGIVAIGAPGMETPLGHYYVAARFVPYNDPFLGVFGVETSGYSRLTEWPGGGWFGIHGTDMPQLLGQRVSHGCIRVSNETATKLRQYTPLGTPIVITD